MKVQPKVQSKGSKGESILGEGGNNRTQGCVGEANL